MISVSQPGEDPEQVTVLMFPKPLFSGMCLKMLIIACGKQRELPCSLAPVLPVSLQKQMGSGSQVQKHPNGRKIDFP